MKSKSIFAGVCAAFCLIICGCDFDFPLTTKPTRKIDERLLGDWVGVDKNGAKEDLMHVRQFDDSTYVVSMDDEIYRAFHSDFADTLFLSVQELKPGSGKYLYFRWQLSADGTQLSLKSVSTKVIPGATKNARDVQRLIKENLGNPKLFRDEVKFTRKKPSF